MSLSDRDRDAIRKRESRLVDRLVNVQTLQPEERSFLALPADAGATIYYDDHGGDRIGVAIEDSVPIPDDPDGQHTVEVLLDSEWTEEAVDAALEEAWSQSPFGQLRASVREFQGCVKKAVLESLLGRFALWLVRSMSKMIGR